MRNRQTVLSFALLVAALGTIGFALTPAADQEQAEHPDIDTDIPCDVCHAEITPKVFKSWYVGRHGENNVKCFVCHGSIDTDFTLKPDNFRCVGCHADQVESAAEASCFSCHPPHPLSPHKKMVAAQEGGDK